MKLHHIYIVIFFCCFSCSNRYKNKIEAVDVIPENHNTIIKINAIENLNNSLQNNLLNKELKIEALKLLTDFIDTTQPIYLSYTDDSRALTTKYNDSLIKIDSTNIKTLKTDFKNIFKTISKTDTIYHQVVDSFFIASTNIEIIKSANNKANPDLREYFATTNDETNISVFFKNKIENKLLLNSKLQDSSKFEILDVNTDAKNFIFSGISKSKDSTYSLNAFKNTIPQTFNLSKIIPNDIEAFDRVAYDDYTVFFENLSRINKTSKDSLATLLNLSNEIALIKLKTGNAIAINFLDANFIETEIHQSSVTETYKGIDIFNFTQTDFFSKRLQPFIQKNKVSKGFVFENFLVFSDKISTLEKIISNKLNNNTLSESEKFKSINQHLASTSSFMIYKNENELANYFDHNIKKYNTNIVQFSYDTDFAHINGVFSNYKKGANQNSVTEDFSINLPNEILVAPQTVKNYSNGGNDIVVQDVANTIYQISNTGRVLWKRKIDGPILGQVKQIDIYKNGRLQIAFATKNNVYLIDRKGKDVASFPMKFNDDITQPLSVFDYDNRKNYRLLVTQNKQLLMYDAKGKRVNGFTYKKAANTISSQPKHFRINSKDYIVFSQGKKLEILNRQGKERIKVNGEINFSDSGIFNFQNRFITKAENGKYVQVDTEGQMKELSYKFNKDSKITASSKTLVALTENKLTIKTKTVDLDFGNFTAPRIFYLNDKIYVTTTDLQSKKVYVFDSQAKSLPNFPVFGTSSAEIEKLGRKNDIYIITQSDNKSVIVYKIN